MQLPVWSGSNGIASGVCIGPMLFVSQVSFTLPEGANFDDTERTPGKGFMRSPKRVSPKKPYPFRWVKSTQSGRTTPAEILSSSPS